MLIKKTAYQIGYDSGFSPDFLEPYPLTEACREEFERGRRDGKKARELWEKGKEL